MTAWPLLAAARDRGYDARIGFEDTLRLPDGQIAAPMPVWLPQPGVRWLGRGAPASAG